MADKYILNGREPVEASLDEWALWFESADRDVLKTTLDNNVKVSTVFIGLNHQFGDGPPMIFETMIFGGDHDEDMWRCSTWDEAESQHQKAIELAQELKPEQRRISDNLMIDIQFYSSIGDPHSDYSPLLGDVRLLDTRRKRYLKSKVDCIAPGSISASEVCNAVVDTDYHIARQVFLHGDTKDEIEHKAWKWGKKCLQS